MRTKFIWNILLAMGIVCSAYAQNMPRPMIDGPYGLSVNSYTGSVLYQRTDMEVPGRGMPTVIGFSYSTANDTVNRGFGKGWTFDYHYAYEVKGDSLWIMHPDGKLDLYRGPVGNIYTPPVGVFDSLKQEGGSLVLRKKNGMRYFFENATHKRLTKISDLNGNTVVLTYAGNYPVQITNASGRSVALNWSNGFLQSVSDASYAPPRTVQLSYDDQVRLISVTNPLGEATTFGYAGDGYMLSSMTDPKGNPVQITYGPDFRVREINTCVHSLVFNFQNDFGRSFFIQKVGGKDLVRVYQFDTLGRFAALDNPSGARKTYAYDDQNRLVEQTDFNGNKTRYTYNEHGNVLTETDALNNTATYTYNNSCTCGKPATFTDKRGNTVSFAYDASGNLTGITNPAGTATMTYNGFGELTGITDPRSKSTALVYDAQGNLTQVNSPIGSTALQYDAAGNLTGITDANNLAVTFVYDRLGRVISSTDAKGFRTHYTYDAAGNLAKIINPRGRERIFSYDPLNRLTGVQYGVEQISYVYDEAGNLVEMSNPRGQKTRFAYDLNNRMVAETDPLGNKTTFVYDANGNLLQKVNPDGSLVQFQYDMLNRLVARTYGGTETDTYGYDAQGNLTSAVNSVAAYLMEYDALARLVKVTNASWGKTVQYQYDAAGNRTRMTDPNGGQHQYAYDDNNRLLSLTDPLGQQYAFQYDAGGRLSRKDNPNNTHTTYQYDAGNNLVDITNFGPGNTEHSFFRYTLDSLGFRASMEDQTGLHRYYYDANDRLKKVIYSNADTVEYVFDAFGNVIERKKNGLPEPFSYNVYDQLVSGGGASYQFDLNGNLAARSGGNQPVLDYQFDALNRFRGGQFANGKRVEYFYDPLGNLVQRRDTSSNMERYMFDGLNLLANLDGANTVNTIFTHFPLLDGWLGKIENGNQSRVFLRDGLGSVTGVLDGSGQDVNAYQYDVYGSIRNATGNEENKVLFSGRLWDGELGLYDYRARFIDPAVGRFISEDKFFGYSHIPVSRNKYLSFNANPVVYTDANGEYVHIIAAVGLGAALGALGEAASQAIQNPGKDMNWCKVGVAAAAGGLGGLLGAIGPFGGSLVGSIGNNVIGSAYSEALTQVVNNEYSAVGAVSSVVLGGIGGGAIAKGSSVAFGDGLQGLMGQAAGGTITATVDGAIKGANSGGGGGGGLCDPPQNPNDPNGPNGDPNPSGEPGTSGGQSGQIPAPAAVDPNEIIAPKGYGPERWVADKDRMPFTILFENDPELGATAPAKRVYIRHPLPVKINSNSFRVGDFGFGPFVFDVPENRASYTTRLDLRDSIGLYVDVTAGLDIQKNEAFWVFQSIDPATGLESTVGALDGFLPVNDSLLQNGEGFVTFSVAPKNSVQTRDTVVAQATIFFDDQDPVETNVERNLLDAGKPTSMVQAPAAALKDSIVLTFSGNDDPNGVGVGSYSLYVSKNNGPFQLHQKDIPGPEFVFKGQADTLYGFYALAKDHVGNEEDPKFGAEATTLASNGAIQISARVLLQGPYVAAANLMHDSLRVQNRIPLTEPYTVLNTFVHTGGGGGEQTTPAVLAVTGPNAIVDWVFLELRSATSAAQVVATRAALLQRNGDVVDVDGVSPVTFATSVNAANYYLTVRHRNHLGVQLGASKFYARGSVVATDFTIVPPEGFYSHNGLSQPQRLVSGKYTLWAANGRIDPQLKYNGSNNDRAALLMVVGLTTPNAIVPGYLQADYNLDGVVKYNGTANDRNVLLGNVGIATPSAVVEEQVAR